MRSLEANRLLEMLLENGAQGDLWRATIDYLSHAGFDRVIFMSVSDAPGPCVRTTMADTFLDIYTAEGFGADDPFLTYCLPSRQNIQTGLAYVDQHDYLPQRSKALIETAASFGFNAGVSVCFPAFGSASTEGWNLGSSLSRREVEQIWDRRGCEISFALHALSGRLSRPSVHLTDRELAVMRLLVSGKRTKQIAADLGVAHVTVEFHLKNARQKLGATTRDAAVARFVQQQRYRPGD